MTTLEDLWPGVEAAAPDNPAPLLVCADCCDESGEPQLAFALRWCAGHGKRPHRRPEVRRWPWRWIRENAQRPKSVTQTAVRSMQHCVLSQWIFAVARHPTWCIDHSQARWAYNWLANQLWTLRGVVEIPNVVLPPPTVLPTGPVQCAGCGVLRARDRLDCPVCRSTEVTR